MLGQYAVIATFKLPKPIGSSVIAEIYLGRYRDYETAQDAVAKCTAHRPALVLEVMESLEADTHVAPGVTYHVRYESVK